MAALAAAGTAAISIRLPNGEYARLASAAPLGGAAPRTSSGGRRRPPRLRGHRWRRGDGLARADAAAVAAAGLHVRLPLRAGALLAPTDARFRAAVMRGSWGPLSVVPLGWAHRPRVLSGDTGTDPASVAVLRPDRAGVALAAAGRTLGGAQRCAAISQAGSCKGRMGESATVVVQPNP